MPRPGPVASRPSRRRSGGDIRGPPPPPLGASTGSPDRWAQKTFVLHFLLTPELLLCFFCLCLVFAVAFAAGDDDTVLLLLLLSL